MRNELSVLYLGALLIFAASIGSAAEISQTAAIGNGQLAASPNPTRLHCRAERSDLGIYEPLRIMSITVDPAKKYVKVVHEGDGRTFEFTDGCISAQGCKDFVRVTEEAIAYGQGREPWKIDRSRAH